MSWQKLLYLKLKKKKVHKESQLSLDLDPNPHNYKENSSSLYSLFSMLRSLLHWFMYIFFK